MRCGHRLIRRLCDLLDTLALLRRGLILTWTKWRPIEVPSAHQGPAAYQIRAVRKQSPLRMPRLLRPDSSGLLAIGETGAFEARRRQFCRGLSYGAGHSEANLIWLLCRTTSVRELLCGARIEYRLQVVDSKDAAMSLEKELLWEYASVYGEVPPFNSSFPGRRERISGHRRRAR
jgi:hypothetical protein